MTCRRLTYAKCADLIPALARELRFLVAEQLGPLRIVYLAHPDMRLVLGVAIHPTPRSDAAGLPVPKVTAVLWWLWLPRRWHWLEPEPPPLVVPTHTPDGRPIVLVPGCYAPRRHGKWLGGGWRKVTRCPVRVAVPSPTVAYLTLPSGEVVEVGLGEAREITMLDVWQALPAGTGDGPVAAWPGKLEPDPTEAILTGGALS
jgi:hypothetical protein